MTFRGRCLSGAAGEEGLRHHHDVGQVEHAAVVEVGERVTARERMERMAFDQVTAGLAGERPSEQLNPL